MLEFKIKVHLFGVLNTGTDIIIIGSTLFMEIAAVATAVVARLKKKNFTKADKISHTYDQKPFTFDGRMDLDIAFGDKTILTPLDENVCHKAITLSGGGVCCQLGIVAI